MIHTQNMNKNDNMLVLDLSLFSIFCNFHKKQEILIDNKIGNGKENKKNETKNRSKIRKIREKITESQRRFNCWSTTIQPRVKRAGQRVKCGSTSRVKRVTSSVIPWWCQQVIDRHVHDTPPGSGLGVAGSDGPRENTRTLGLLNA